MTSEHDRYDLVIDTSQTPSLDEVVDRIVAAVEATRRDAEE